jgi:peptidoglycan/xylan/chitin deacetylase (PgdA/CDA1 family)
VHPLALPPEQLLAQVRALRRLGPLRVTFDDGFRNIERVIPELERLGVPVTVFVCTSFADRGGAPLTVGELDTSDPDDLTGLQTMTWEQLCDLRDRGVSIGSHTVSHPHLVQLSDDEALSELVESKQRIEAVVGRPCTALAYPYGEHNARVRGVARKAGYERAYALDVSGGDEFGEPRLELHRRDGVGRTIIKALTLRVRSRDSRPPAER